MARDPDQGASFVFDLVDDAEDPGAPPAGSGGAIAYGADEVPADDDVALGGGSTWRGLRLLAPLAAVVAVVLGTGLTVDGVRDAQRVERVRELPGGVVDVSRPLSQLWEVERDVGSTEIAVGWREHAVAVLGGDLVFMSGRELIALDVATGEQAWAVPLGEDADCGPMGFARWEQASTASSVVCFEGAGADRTVMLVGPGGTRSAQRELPPADVRRYGEPRPGPDGTVLRARRVGPASAVDLNDARCREAGGCSGTVTAGRDLALRAEDAVTGEERWTTVIPFRTTPAEQCSSWMGTYWAGPEQLVSDQEKISPDAFGGEVGTDLVQMHGCGVEAAVTPDGVALGTDHPSATGYVSRLRSGGFVEQVFEPEARTVRIGEDGEHLVEIPGYASEPVVTDGSGPQTLLVLDGTTPRLRAHELDGTLRWEVGREDLGPQFLAQVRGAAVVMTGTGVLRGLDVVTGAELWELENPYTADGDGGEGLYVTSAFTDGRFVLLQFEGSPGGGTTLVSVDALSGETIWQQDGDDAAVTDLVHGVMGGLLAVDGHLMEVRASGIRGLG